MTLYFPSQVAAALAGDTRGIPHRLKGAVAEVNGTHDVGDLCQKLPARVAQLILEEGGRLAK